MEQRYWIGRKRAAMVMARGAASADLRLLHYELAGRYSIKAAQCHAVAKRETGGERPMLHLSGSAFFGPAPVTSFQDQGSEFLSGPGPSMGEVR
jgi:hypothetical protein